MGSWGDWAAGEALFEAMSRGELDHFMLTPSAAPDARFHHEVSGFLLEWAESQRIAPHSFWLADSPRAARYSKRVGSGHERPLVVFANGTLLADPSDADIATATGSTIEPMRRDFRPLHRGRGPRRDFCPFSRNVVHSWSAHPEKSPSRE